MRRSSITISCHHAVVCLQLLTSLKPKYWFRIKIFQIRHRINHVLPILLISYNSRISIEKQSMYSLQLCKERNNLLTVSDQIVLEIKILKLEEIKHPLAAISIRD